jgi:hypothetical protein
MARCSGAAGREPGSHRSLKTESFLIRAMIATSPQGDSLDLR